MCATMPSAVPMPPVSPAFPATKFHPPSLRRGTLARTALLDGAAGDALPRVLLVCAPAGFGKTTAVRQWLERTGVAFAWVSLDPDDQDPWAFWAAVAESLTRSLPGAAAVQPGAGGDGDLRADVLVPLLDLLASSAAPPVLVLEDLHVICHEQTLASLDWWLARLPERCAVALTTRTDPDLPALETLRARGDLVELRSAALRFDLAEITDLLSLRFDLELTDDQLSQIEFVTEGWPAALNLVGLGLCRGEPLATVLAPAGAQDPVTALVRGALAARSEHDRDVLLGISVLQQLSAPLVDALLRDPTAWPVITAVAERTELLIGLDGDGTRWRLHHLVREVLEAELARLDPARHIALHRRAAELAQDRGDLATGMHHLLAAQDWAAASNLLGGVYNLMAVPRHSTAVTWLRRIPIEVRRRDPRLCFLGAWVATMVGDKDLRDVALAAGRQVAGAGPVGDCASWESAEQVVLAAVTFDDVSAAFAAAERALTLEPADSRPAAITRWKRGALLYLSGRAGAAATALEELMADEAWDPPIGPLIVLPPAYLALARLELGDVDGAAPLAHQAVDARRRTAFAQELHSLVAFEALARVRTAEGDPATGLAVALDAVRRSTEGGVDTMLVIPRLLGEVARAHHALGDPGAAAVAITQALELVAGARDPGDLPRRFAEIVPDLEPPSATRAEAPLSRRELEVLALLPSPLSAAQIAAELFVSANTVRTHIKAIHRKLGATSRADAVLAARREGLLRAG